MNAIQQTEKFSEWFEGLKDAKARQAIVRRIVQMEGDLFGDVEPVGEGVSEARIHYGPGYRLYFKRIGNTVFVLLCGGTKRTQKKDIAMAIELAAQL